MDKLIVTSPAFAKNSLIPARFTCDGENVNPPLSIGNIPLFAETIVLIVEDPDAPLGTWDHWIVWDIPAKSKNIEIRENTSPGIQGINDFNNHKYGGPCPPTGKHRYFFKAYAIDTVLDLSADSKKAEVMDAIKGHVIAEGQVIGLYQRKYFGDNLKANSKRI